MTRTPRLPLRSLAPPPLDPGLPGDPGLIDPHDVVWRVARERLVLLGGPAALLLQAAHPLVTAGVAEHSDFRTDPSHRMLATLQAVLTVTFGDTRQARALAGRIGGRHVEVVGSLSSDVGGFEARSRYDATDPRLALWVHATLVWCALGVHDRYVEPVGDGLRDAYWQQAMPFARALGVTDEMLPDDWSDFLGWFSDAVARLAVSPDAQAIADDVLAARFSPPVPFAGDITRAVVADLLPERVRIVYGLPLTRAQRALVRTLRLATRVGRRLLPDRVACFPHWAAAVKRVGGH